MGSFGNAESNADATSDDKENCFRKVLRQRWMGSEDYFAKHRVLGRYYVAAMLFSAVTIYIWSFTSIVYNTIDSYYDETNPFYPALKNSTTYRDAIFHGSWGIEICSQIPVALLIYTISSHKFLTLAVAISSIIHMLTPLAVDGGSLLVAIWSQKMVLAPLRIAVLSMWKDWAPPHERKRFVIFSLFSWVMFLPSSRILRSLYLLYATKASFYVTGVCGLAWSLLWFFTVSDTPVNNSQDLQNKQISQHNNSFTIFKEIPKLSEAPWKNIIRSMPVFSLCLLYFKIGSSFIILDSMSVTFAPRREEDPYIQTIFYQLLFVSVYIVVFSISALITDFLARKYPGMVKIRKGILCGALIIHAILLFGTLSLNTTVVVTFSWLSNIVLSTSLTGIFTNALDLSSQYVSIIGGFIETSYLLGMFFSLEFMGIYDYWFEDMELINAKGIILSYEIGLTIIVAVVFYIWGSLEEQPWSLNSSSGAENGNPQSSSVQEDHELKGAVPQNT